MRKTTLKYAIVCGLILQAAAARTPAPPAPVSVFSDLPNGRDGTNVEAAVYTDAMGFDKEVSESF